MGSRGPCPAATTEQADGINGGRCGGRACWVIAGTWCDESVPAGYPSKVVRCQACPFFHLVREEEGERFVIAREIMRRVAS